MPRIPLFDPEHCSPQQRQVHDAIVSGPRGRLVGPLRAVLLIPELADRWQKFGEQLRYNTALPKRCTELAIITVARRWNSQVEWLIHAQAAKVAGVPDAVMAAVQVGDAPEFDDEVDADVYEFTRQLLMDGDTNDSLHARLVECFGADGVVELTAVIGYYTMVSMMLNAQAVPTPNGESPPLHPVTIAKTDGLLTPLPARKKA